MNDEQMQSALDEWFEDTDPEPPNARRTATNVMAHVPQTRQRGRWLPFRLFRPKAQTPTATRFIPAPSMFPALNGAPRIPCPTTWHGWRARPLIAP